MGCATFVIGIMTHQKWTDLPDSPALSSDYPYQVVIYLAGRYELGVFKTPLSITRTEYTRDGYDFVRWSLEATTEPTTGLSYYLVDGEWILNGETNHAVETTSTAPFTSGLELVTSCIQQVNRDIYYDTTLSFAHTTDNVAGGSANARVRKFRVIV
jgi:hypothetical protein